MRQSTASQSRLIGPFVDDTDFKTAETALTIANTDVKLRANGTTLANKNSGGGTHQVNGMYSLTYDATDSANVGELKYSVVVAGALQVFGSYWVLEEAVYDALFGASAAGYGTAQTGDSFARLGAPAGVSVSQDVANVSSDIAGVQADTNDIQTRLPAALSSGRMPAALTAVPSEPAAVFTWGVDTLEAILAFVGALASNRVTETATAQTLRNRADAATIATSTVSDDGTTAVRGSFS